MRSAAKAVEVKVDPEVEAEGRGQRVDSAVGNESGD